MASSHGRLVQVNQTVLDQADFFQGDGFTRVTGITIPQLTSQLFFNNVLQPWPLISGLSITDAQIASGNVYFNEIPGSPGFYSIRFRPSAVGFWRNILTYPAGTQINAQDYDVVPTQPFMEAGLHASFVKPTC